MKSTLNNLNITFRYVVALSFTLVLGACGSQSKDQVSDPLAGKTYEVVDMDCDGTSVATKQFSIADSELTFKNGEVVGGGVLQQDVSSSSEEKSSQKTTYRVDSRVLYLTKGSKTNSYLYKVEGKTLRLRTPWEDRKRDDLCSDLSGSEDARLNITLEEK